MSWRSVLIANPARLRREHAALLVEQEQTARIPFEDLAVIVLDHREIAITQAVLAACSEHRIALFATDDRHLPGGVFLPFLAHSRSTRLLRLQLGLGRPRTKQAWAAIVRAKIANQARCLELCGSEGADKLHSYARRVRSGDPDNLEAQAGAFYFPRLFGKGFIRSADLRINAALNYGYAIVRGAVARGLVTHGLHPSLGLFHASEQNPFNLADDLLEPLRPQVDLVVRQQVEADSRAEGPLSSADKVRLVGLLHVEIEMPGGAMTVLAAIELMVESLVRLHESEGEPQPLALPRLSGTSVRLLRDS